METVQKHWESLLPQIVSYAPRVIGALAVLIIGWTLISFAAGLVRKALARKAIDPSLQSFSSSCVSALLKVLLLLSVAGMVGIQVTSFVAILGAASLAIGMALSSTLQNFAGGVMILLFKPFVTGDFIEAQGHAGKVKEIQIFNTILTTADNKTIIIPNAPLSSGSMINYSTEPNRRVDLTFSIGYDDDIDTARSLIEDIVKADSRIHNDPEPVIKVAALADSSVNLTTRVWTARESYWDVNFDMLERVKKAFDQHGISIPFPQQDIHVHAVEQIMKKAIGS